MTPGRASILPRRAAWTTTPGDPDFFIEYEVPCNQQYRASPGFLLAALLWVANKPLLVEEVHGGDGVRVVRVTLGLTPLSGLARISGEWVNRWLARLVQVERAR